MREVAIKIAAGGFLLLGASAYASAPDRNLRGDLPADLSASLPASLPMIAGEQFRVGKNWTWTYYEEGDVTRPYSAENYRVVARQGDLVTIEIASRYDDHSAFAPNTRFKVDLSRCFQAFKRPDLKMNFMIDLYPMQQGRWARSAIRTPATAFEEKFNCNPVLHSRQNSLYETRFVEEETPWGVATLFQQWPKFPKSQVRAYYFLAIPELAGVAWRKSFNQGSPGYYEMRLTAWSR